MYEKQNKLRITHLFYRNPNAATYTYKKSYEWAQNSLLKTIKPTWLLSSYLKRLYFYFIYRNTQSSKNVQSRFQYDLHFRDWETLVVNKSHS